jgi:uncharacterized OB-fold protein
VDISARQWWEHIERRELVVQSCLECGILQHPPGPLCRSCKSSRLEWKPHPGTGTLVSCTQVHRTTYPEWEAETPYWIVLVELAPGANLIANLLHSPGGASPRAGQRVALTFHEHAGRTLPAFELSSAEAGP